MKLTQEQRDELIELRRSGKSFQWLGEHFNISDTTAWKICGGKGFRVSGSEGVVPERSEGPNAVSPEARDGEERAGTPK